MAAMRSFYTITFLVISVLAIAFAVVSITRFESTERAANLQLAVTVFCNDGETPSLEISPATSGGVIELEVANADWGMPINCYEIDLSGPEDQSLPHTSGYAIVQSAGSTRSGGGCSEPGAPNEEVPLQVLNDLEQELHISLPERSETVFCLRLSVQDTSSSTSLSQRRLSFEASHFQHPTNQRQTLPIRLELDRGFSIDEMLPEPDDLYLNERRRVYVWNSREGLNRSFIDVYYSNDRLRYLQDFLFLLSASMLGAVISMGLAKLYERSRMT